jgi:tRNA A37 threonylcarbamoyltransferase TsaD
MCTYTTERIPVQGSAKGANGWFSPTMASVYYDHPVHAQATHSLNIDFLAPEAGPGARVALELTAETARSLAAAIEAALASVPVELLE